VINSVVFYFEGTWFDFWQGYQVSSQIFVGFISNIVECSMFLLSLYRLVKESSVICWYCTTIRSKWLVWLYCKTYGVFKVQLCRWNE